MGFLKSWVWVFAAVVMTAACDDDGGGAGGTGDAAGDTGGAGDAAATGPACQRTESLDEARSCRRADDCPCGAYCDLGQCVFDCRADGDCEGGQVCDDFGRCREPGEARVGALSVGASQAVVVEPLVLRTSSDTPYFVRIRPRVGSAGRVRVVAVGDAVLSCGEVPAVDGECLFDQVPPEGVEIAVAAPAVVAKAEGDPIGVDVHDEGGGFVPVRMERVGGGGPDVPLAGVYGGTVVLAGGPGSGGAAGLEASVDVRDLQVPVRARVFADAAGEGVLVLEDAERLLLPVSPLVLGLAADGTVRLPGLVWLAADAQAGDAAEITSAFSSAVAQVGAGHFEVELPMNLMGMGLAGDATPVRLRLALTRVGSLPADATAPVRTPDQAAQLSAGRGTGHLPVSTTVINAARAAAGTPEAIRALLVRDQRSLPACDADVPAFRSDTVGATCQANQHPLVRSDCAVTRGTARDLVNPVLIPCAWEVDEPAPNAGCVPAREACLAPCDNPDNNRDCFLECRIPLGDLQCDEQCETLRPDIFFGGGPDCVEDPNCQDCRELGPNNPCNSACPSFCRRLCREACPVCRIVTQHNRCEAVAAILGCQPEPAVDIALAEGTMPDTSTRVTGVCRLAAPEAPSAARCALATLCADSTDLAALVEIGALSPLSGDPLCGESASEAALILEAVPTDLEAHLAACLTDLERGPAPVDPFATDGCLAFGRLLAALDRAATPLRAGTPDEAAAAMLHRITQQLVEVQTVTTRFALEVNREAIALSQGDRTQETLDALTRAQAVWRVILDPRVAGPLRAIPPAVLSDPDPRPRLDIEVPEGAPAAAARGLPVTLLEGLAQELELLDYLLERAWFEGDPVRRAERRTRLGAALRTAHLVAVLADDLRRNTANPPRWETQWLTARQRYALSVRRALNRLVAIDSGANPLGIQDENVPLYFRGDPEGDVERFSAVSRYFTGEGPGSIVGLAPVALTEATEALEAARLEWRVRTDLDLNGDRRIEDLVRRYGELVTIYCGAPIDDPDFDVGSFNVLDRPLDTEVCFVEPACRPRPEDFLEKLQVADLGRGLCITTRLQAAYGVLAGQPSAELKVALDALAPLITRAALGTRAFPFTIVDASQDVNDRSVTVQIEGRGRQIIPLDALGALSREVSPALLAPSTGGAFNPEADDPLVGTVSEAQRILDDCDTSRQATLARRPTRAPAVCRFADECPRNFNCILGACTADDGNDPLDQVDCYYDGAISEQALAVRATATDVEIARLEFEEFIDRYDIAKRSCILLHAGNEALEDQLADHQASMRILDQGRTNAVAIATLAGAAKDCASGFNVDSIVTGAVAGICVAAGVEAIANIAVESMDRKMREAERSHENATQRIQNNTEEARCFNDAEIELVGARAATLRIRQAKVAQATSIINLRGQKSYTAGLWNEGNIAIANERARLSRSLPNRFILSELAQTYLQRFRSAQRLTYLAVRAAEYEFQATLVARREALAATTPADLEQVLRTVAGTVNTNRVEGRVPASLTAVLSLKEHLLQLRDRSQNPPGEHTLTDIERFRLVLTDAQYSVYDEDGEYAGQQIPFSIQPLGSIGLGQSEGIPILASNDCAERVWSVNAAVIGEDALAGGGARVESMQLLQRNTFFSQWCSSPGDDEPEFQVSAVRPEVNLLNDWNWSGDQRPQPLSETAGDTFARARMQPWVNVTRQEFEREDYAEGASGELAGRGLYGDYALFIPAGVLALGGVRGLQLDKVSEILLRFDYVSVARD